MRGNIYSRIFIPKPCHEDWNQMTPDEKGAFCKSCNKSVYDFTAKNEAQVESILTATKGQEVCGRFNPTQLAPLPELEIPIHLLPRNVSPYRKFVLAVFIVFGTALFGCVNSYGQKMGKVRIVDTPVSANVQEEEMIKGEVAVRGNVKVIEAQEKLPAVKVEQTVTMGDTIFIPPVMIDNEMHMLGGVSFLIEGPVEVTEQVVENITGEPEKTADLVDVIEPVRISCGLALMTEEAITGSEVITGGLPVSYADVLEVQAEDITIIETIVCQTITEVQEAEELVNENDAELVLPVQEEGDDHADPVFVDGGSDPSLECYPNPSSGPVNIRYEIKKRCDVRLEVFDRSGRKVRTLLDSKGYYNGIYNTAYDLSDLDAGTYICVLQAGEQVSSARIVITK